MIRSGLVVTKPTPVAARGMVVAEHPLGAQVGARILARGGNAVDAAVATAFAMPVVEPFMSTLAGGGSMLIHLARRGETVALDFNVEAPAACDEACYALGDGVAGDLFPWRLVVDDANIHGPRAVAVPGTVAGLCLALEKYGTMELADALAPAIALAERGFVPDWYVALTTALYGEELLAYPETARTYLRDGRHIHRPPCVGEGDVFRQPELARSLGLIAREGPQAFYRGAIADAIDEAMRAAGGFLTRDDLAAYAARVVTPLPGRYRGLDLAMMPGATGGITALEILNILAQFPSARVGHGTVAGLHLRAEAVRLAFLDRLRLLGDALRVKAPWAGLASPDYARALARGLKGRGRRGEVDPWAYEGATTAAVPAGPRWRPARGRRDADDCTTHVGAVDRQRNMVSLTNTAVSLWGARMMAPGTGILLSNGMIWFDPEPGRANSIAPGKRPLVNMVPLLAFRNGAPYLTLGAPGGRKIVSVIPQVLSNMVDLGESPPAAMAAPRLHTEGAELWLDDRVPAAHVAALRRSGLSVVLKHSAYGTFDFARPVAIRVTRKGLEAGLDPLSAAAAAGL